MHPADKNWDLPCVRSKQSLFEVIGRRVVDFAQRKVGQASLRWNKTKFWLNLRIDFQVGA